MVSRPLDRVNFKSSLTVLLMHGVNTGAASGRLKGESEEDNDSRYHDRHPDP